MPRGAKRGPDIHSLLTRQDTGCHLHPSCLDCPAAQCIYDISIKPKMNLAVIMSGFGTPQIKVEEAK